MLTCMLCYGLTFNDVLWSYLYCCAMALSLMLCYDLTLSAVQWLRFGLTLNDVLWSYLYCCAMALFLMLHYDFTLSGAMAALWSYPLMLYYGFTLPFMLDLTFIAVKCCARFYPNCGDLH